MKKIIWSVAIYLFIITACSSDNEEELFPNNTCDTTSVSFTDDIVPIFTASCLGCHSLAAAPFAGANIILEGYDNVLVQITNQRLVGSIEHASNFSPMPKGGAKLPACEIDKIKAWVNNGAPNN